ncbi:MAG TPA: hypothetical protein VGI67_02755 [Thermoleophilaceae bacterium]|jgi:hypothetical protein
MIDEERKDEGNEEEIEDLEAPADQQEDVAGGNICAKPTTFCVPPTCIDTKVDCIRLSLQKVERLQ